MVWSSQRAVEIVAQIVRARECCGVPDRVSHAADVWPEATGRPTGDHGSPEPAPHGWAAVSASTSVRSGVCQ